MSKQRGSRAREQFAQERIFHRSDGRRTSSSRSKGLSLVASSTVRRDVTRHVRNWNWTEVVIDGSVTRSARRASDTAIQPEMVADFVYRRTLEYGMQSICWCFWCSPWPVVVWQCFPLCIRLVLHSFVGELTRRTIE